MNETHLKEIENVANCSIKSMDILESVETEDKKLKKNMENNSDNENDTEERKNIPGVLYLSRIPTRMNVKIIRDYFSNFGQVDRIYLEPMEQKRKNQPRAFAEGWVEFKKKKIAKKVAKMLNNMQVGGKRRNPWFNELWNIKYLKNFRWTHLNERLAYEQETRKQRLRQEIALAKKEANFYIQNVEKNEKRKRFEKKQKNSDQSEINNDENTSKIQFVSSTNQTENNEDFKSKKNHPVFEKKIKVVGNDSFLRQIFS